MNNNKQPALLSVTQLHKTYASRDGLVTAIDHISLEVQAGETVALVGESGCGKSTVAATLLGLLPADSGQILVEGRPLPTDARARGRS